MAGPILRIEYLRSKNARGGTSCKGPLRKANYSEFLSRRLNFRGKEFGKDLSSILGHTIMVRNDYTGV
jgi:hypothetical protein